MDWLVEITVAAWVNVGATFFLTPMLTVTAAVPPWPSLTVTTNESDAPLSHAEPNGVYVCQPLPRTVTVPPALVIVDPPYDSESPSASLPFTVPTYEVCKEVQRRTIAQRQRRIGVQWNQIHRHARVLRRAKAVGRGDRDRLGLRREQPEISPCIRRRMPSRIRRHERPRTVGIRRHRAPAVVGLGGVGDRITVRIGRHRRDLRRTVDESVIVAVAGVVNVGASFFLTPMLTVTDAVPP